MTVNVSTILLIHFMGWKRGLYVASPRPSGFDIVDEITSPVFHTVLLTPIKIEYGSERSSSIA